jgi:2-keto-4-pentenoate hydratase/2-oxohepta-3-ene-1,7-dioic acid hydratase in catechol pathway
MKIYTLKKDNKEFVAIETKFGKLLPLENLNIYYKTMLELIEHNQNPKFNILKSLSNSDDLSKSVIPFSKTPVDLRPFLLDFSDIELCAPIPVPAQDLICLGLNYSDHANESAKFKKSSFSNSQNYPVYFSKRVSRASGSGETIPAYTGIVDSLDYEAELALIIGKECKNVTKHSAYEYVFGYTIINDVTARNIQMRHNQWYFGKSFDGFLPMGPCIVTADEFLAPPVLKIQSRVNGEVRQHSSTDKLIYDIPHIITELSQGFTLKPGTIIALGTPAGVGMGFDPPKWLKSGDKVECEIEKIGILSNVVK